MANKKKPKGIGAALKGYGRALGIIDKPRKYETKTHIYEIDPGFLCTTIEMSYVQRLDTLSSTNTTNWLTKNAQELLLFGALMEACTFSKNREDLQIYSQRYQAAVQSVNNQARRRRRDDYNAPMNVMGENNIQQATT